MAAPAKQENYVHKHSLGFTVSVRLMSASPAGDVYPGYVVFEMLSLVPESDFGSAEEFVSCSAPVRIPDVLSDSAGVLLDIYEPDEQLETPAATLPRARTIGSALPHILRGMDDNIYKLAYTELEVSPWLVPRVTLVRLNSKHASTALEKIVPAVKQALAEANTRAGDVLARLRSQQAEVARLEREMRTYKSGAELTVQGLQARCSYFEARAELLFQQQNLFRNTLLAYASEESWSGDQKNVLLNSINGFAPAADALRNIVSGEVA